MTKLLFLAMALVAQGQDCPWINTATASGILHGEASADVRPGSCTFTANGSTLHIEVTTSPHAAADMKRAHSACENEPKPLVGIGNEAFICGGKVIGRVRDQVFMITAATNDRTIDSRVLSERARAAASQVSGILY